MSSVPTSLLQCLAFLIKLVEVYVIVNGGLIQADRDQYKPHGDGALVCNCHGNPFFLFRISVCNLGIFIQELLKKGSAAAGPISFVILFNRGYLLIKWWFREINI